MATASAARLQKEAPEDKEENSERGVMRHSNRDREEKERKGKEGGQASVKERGEGSDGDGWRGWSRAAAEGGEINRLKSKSGMKMWRELKVTLVFLKAPFCPHWCFIMSLIKDDEPCHCSRFSHGDVCVRETFYYYNMIKWIYNLGFKFPWPLRSLCLYCRQRCWWWLNWKPLIHLGTVRRWTLTNRWNCFFHLGKVCPMARSHMSVQTGETRRANNYRDQKV